MTKSKIQEFYLTAKKLNEIRSESFLYFGHFLCLQIKLLLSREFPPVRLIFLTSNIWSEGKGFFFFTYHPRSKYDTECIGECWVLNQGWLLTLSN